MTAPDRIETRAYAKVNLALAVGPPLPPPGSHAGYHPIASWMHAVDLADAITLTRSDSTEYDFAWDDGGPVGWDPASDLCARAHRALESLAERTLPLRIRVRKSIPAGGGLGGGSADAAAVLLGIRTLFRLPVSDGQLAACAHALGTDIPFFLDPQAREQARPQRPAVVHGLGERMDRLPRRNDSLTLICPPFGCATGAVYRAFDAHPTRHCDEVRVRAVAESAAGAIDPHALFNDLAAPAERVEPRLALLRRGLEHALDTPIHVSGSGSTLFCFAEPQAVRPHAPGCRVIGTRLV
jgi:4-diphosphocytidyl-2-C-methyl-D-erythritol kinase